MKHKYSLAAGFLLIAILLPMLFVANSVHGVETGSPLKFPTDPNNSSTFTTRLVKLELSYKTQLEALSRERIEAKCQAAQSRIKILKSNYSNQADKRQQVYDKLATRLNQIIFNLKKQGINTSRISNSENAFDQSINTYLADSKNYQTVLDDALTVNCSDDPTGFYAAVLEARRLRLKIVTDEQVIKSKVPELAAAIKATGLLLAKNSAAVQGGSQ